MIGKVHSIQSLGAVDGPGLRCVIFLQGCPLRCIYCHNPDTWDYNGGTEFSTDELINKIIRFRPYFQNNGGVTVSGGEPLSQAKFVQELFQKLQSLGIHTALDTSGFCDINDAKDVLSYTDLVLADLKFLTKEDYKRYCGVDIRKIERFLSLTEEMNIPLWLRHVVVPNYTDSLDHLIGIKKKAESLSNLIKIEWLPFNNICMNKYNDLGLEFPLGSIPSMPRETLERLIKELESNQK